MVRASSGVIARAGDASRPARMASAIPDRTSGRVRPPVRVRTTSVMCAGARSMLRSERLNLLQSLHGLLLPKQAVADAGGVQRGALLMRELIVVREELLHLRLDGHDQPHVAREEFDGPAAV